MNFEARADWTGRQLFKGSILVVFLTLLWQLSSGTASSSTLIFVGGGGGFVGVLAGASIGALLLGGILGALLHQFAAMPLQLVLDSIGLVSRVSGANVDKKLKSEEQRLKAFMAAQEGISVPVESQQEKVAENLVEEARKEVTKAQESLSEVINNASSSEEMRLAAFMNSAHKKSKKKKSSAEEERLAAFMQSSMKNLQK